MSSSGIHSTPSCLLMYAIILRQYHQYDLRKQKIHHVDRHSPFMHQNHMRLPTDLRMYTHREDESLILPIREVKLLQPQLFDHARVHEALRPRPACKTTSGNVSECLGHLLRITLIKYLPGIGCKGGQSSKCQFAGISTTHEGRILVIGLIHASAVFAWSVSTHVSLPPGAK